MTGQLSLDKRGTVGGRRKERETKAERQKKSGRRRSSSVRIRIYARIEAVAAKIFLSLSLRAYIAKPRRSRRGCIFHTVPTIRGGRGRTRRRFVKKLVGREGGGVSSREINRYYYCPLKLPVGPGESRIPFRVPKSVVVCRENVVQCTAGQ